jgi:hypothetical protein
MLAPAAPAPGSAVPLEPAPVVRAATADDAPEIMRLLEMAKGEGALAELDLEAAWERLDVAFNKRGGVIGVIGAPGDLEAMLGLLICGPDAGVSLFWSTRRKHLEEFVSYVRPDRRQTSHARTLVAFAKQCADALKIPLVVKALANKDVAEKVRLYRRSFGLPVATVFLYEAGAERGADQADAENENFWRAPFPTHGPRSRGRSRNKARAAASEGIVLDS